MSPDAGQKRECLAGFMNDIPGIQYRELQRIHNPREKPFVMEIRFRHGIMEGKIRTALSDNEKKGSGNVLRGNDHRTNLETVLQVRRNHKKIQTKHFLKPFSLNPATGTVDFHQKW